MKESLIRPASTIRQRPPLGGSLVLRAGQGDGPCGATRPWFTPQPTSPLPLDFSVFARMGDFIFSSFVPVTLALPVAEPGGTGGHDLAFLRSEGDPRPDVCADPVLSPLVDGPGPSVGCPPAGVFVVQETVTSFQLNPGDSITDRSLNI